jgi:regulator of sigma E protease
MMAFHYIFIALEVVLLFNLLIGVHELGHFLAAKWRRLKIDRFAIWFGKPIWKAKIGGVEYALGWIPAGGYVALPQMATMEAIEGKSDTPAGQLPPISAFDKIIVAIAGPLFSFLLALFFAFIVWQVGKPTTEGDNTTQIGWVEPNGQAWKAGLRSGDTILSVNGYPVNHFAATTQDSVQWRVITSEGTNIAVKYQRKGRENTAYVTPYYQPTRWYERKSLRQLQIESALPSIVGGVISNSPAALEGLTNGDEITAIDHTNIYSPSAVMWAAEQMSNGPVRPITLTIHRGNDHFDLTMLAVRPIQPTNSSPSLGIVEWIADTNISIMHPTPYEQVASSLSQIMGTLGAVFSPKTDIGVQQLGGAVMIARVYYNLFQSPDAWRQVLWFSVVLNVNLALINMLPLPVLDGGHILLALIEVIRRRPVSARVLNSIQSGFAALLIGFMLYIAFFDTGDWVRSAHQDRELPVVFAPGPATDTGHYINLAPSGK